MRVILVDCRRDQLKVGEDVTKPRSRWLLPAISALVCAPSGQLDGAALQLALRAAGARSELDRTGVRRVFHGLRQLLDQSLGHGAFDARIGHAARAATTGPWTFTQSADETWIVVDRGGRETVRQHSQGERALSGAATARPMVVDAWGAPPLALIKRLELMLKSDTLALDGDLQLALDRLLAAREAGASPVEITAQLELRAARLCKRLGRFADARVHALDAVRLAGQPGFSDAGLSWVATQLLQRIAYDQAPNAFRGDAFLSAQRPQSLPTDPRLEAERSNLEALVHRRHALELLKNGERAAAQLALREAWSACCGAYYWALSMRDFENAENFAFNLGLIQASLSAVVGESALVVAFACYQLGLQIRDGFSVGRDTVWDHIFIANLWLDHPHLRAKFAELGFESQPLPSLGFYQETLREAKRLGEPRQIALCAINLWRFAASVLASQQAKPVLLQAVDELRRVVHEQPGLLATLRADGMQVMDQMLRSPARGARRSVSQPRR